MQEPHLQNEMQGPRLPGPGALPKQLMCAQLLSRYGPSHHFRGGEDLVSNDHSPDLQRNYTRKLLVDTRVWPSARV